MSENGAESLRKVKQTFMMITAPDGPASTGGETDFVKPMSHNSKVMIP
jgi:hypothetical protein